MVEHLAAANFHGTDHGAASELVEPQFTMCIVRTVHNVALHA